jgi:hypothetical protein
MHKPFETFFSQLQEKNEYKLSDRYKTLSPRMKKAVDDVFKFLESNPSDFLATFDKFIEKTAKKHKVEAKALVQYFEKETLEV